MNLSPENLARHELIGLEVEVESSTDPGLIGLSGKVVDETRNTFLLETKRTDTAHCQIEHEPDLHPARWAESEGQGSVLISQPENRISKRMQRTRWKL